MQIKLRFIENKYHNLKKYKVLNFIFFKLKFRVSNRKKIKKFINKNRPQLLHNFEEEPLRKKVYLSIAAIYKNEPDIIEWIEYHKLAGVERFYLYDNESTDDSLEKLKPYIEDGTVIYKYISGECMQYPVYRDAVCRYKNETHWMAFIDLDEYICPVQEYDIKSVLNDYDKYPGFGINWIMFDSNGQTKQSDKLVIETYTRVMKDYQHKVNHHIKSIIKPEKVAYITNAHFCFYKNKELAVNENYSTIGNSSNYENVNNAFTDYHSSEKIRINHYYSKSLENFKKKVAKGLATSTRKRPKKWLGPIFDVETTNDYVIQKYLPELKKIMETKENK